MEEKIIRMKKLKKLEKGLDESFVACYIMTVAPMRAARRSKPPQSWKRRRMYPENYTMQNMLE